MEGIATSEAKSPNERSDVVTKTQLRPHGFQVRPHGFQVKKMEYGRREETQTV